MSSERWERVKGYVELVVLAVLLAVQLVGLLSGCSSTRFVPVELHTTETVWQHDTTVVVRLEAASDTSRVEADDREEAHSVLENQYAISYADYSDGVLSHTLDIKPGAAVEATVADVREVERIREVPVEVPVPTDKKPEKVTLMERMGYVAIGFALAMLVMLAAVALWLKAIRE